MEVTLDTIAIQEETKRSESEQNTSQASSQAIKVSSSAQIERPLSMVEYI